MFKEVESDGTRAVNIDALKSEVRAALINQKVNACPITMRHAWHMGGTYDKNSRTGGTDGATIRFAPEKTDGANAGLHIIRDLLEPVKRNHPEISYADLYVIASGMAIEFCGGPAIPFSLGRKDESDGRKCPENGRLPDALQGADHLRDVFGRMGFNDQEIVALSGGHTLGSAHRVRSGFDGQWTSSPLKFDNEYFVNLVSRKWTPRKWDGPKQYVDETGTLMMLETDIALLHDGAFRIWVDLYARDAHRFFVDFSASYGKLMALGCPAHVQPGAKKEGSKSMKEEANRMFRHHAMHGFVPPAKALAKSNTVDVHAVDPASGRSALHFASFWGHVGMVKYLVTDLRLFVNQVDFNGDTPLHDAAAHGHDGVAKVLVEAGAKTTVLNRQGKDAATVASEAGYKSVASIIGSAKRTSKL